MADDFLSNSQQALDELQTVTGVDAAAQAQSAIQDAIFAAQANITYSSSFMEILSGGLVESANQLGAASDQVDSVNTLMQDAYTVYQNLKPSTGPTGDQLVDSVIGVAEIPKDFVAELSLAKDLLELIPGGDIVAAPLDLLINSLKPIVDYIDGLVGNATDAWNKTQTEHGPCYVVGADTDVTANPTLKLVINGTEMVGGCGEDGQCGPVTNNLTSKTIQGFEGATYVLPANPGFGPVQVTYNGVKVTMQGWRQDYLSVNLNTADDQSSPQPCEDPADLASPLILDLDGDGIEARGLADGPVFFDVDNDGLAERTGWVGADDGLLAVDLDGDGAINSAEELFGAGRTISHPANVNIDIAVEAADEYDVYSSGFDKLATYDSNHDGVVDASDADFASLRVWRDANSNGRTDAGELLTLDEAGVASLSLASTHAVETFGENLISDRASFTTTGGEIRDVADVWFGFDQRAIRYETPTDLDPEIAALPYLGYRGSLRDLHTAMSEDVVLKGLVQQLAGLGAADAGAAGPLAEQILARWAGADGVDPFSRGYNANAQHIAVMEAIRDTPFLQLGYLPNPRPYAGGELENQWDVLERNVMVDLFLQTPAAQTLFPEFSYFANAAIYLADGADLNTILARLIANAPSDLLDRVGYWYTAIRVIDTVSSSFTGFTRDQAKALVEGALADQGVNVGYDDLVTARIGSDGADEMRLQSTNGAIPPPPYEPFAWQPESRVVLTGAGDDTVTPGGVSETIFWGAGQGNDTILQVFTAVYAFDHPTYDIRMAGLAQSDVTITAPLDPVNDRFVITINATGETLTIDPVDTATFSVPGVFVLDFTDGSLDLAQVFADTRPGPTAGDDALQQVLSNSLDGGAGNDTLYGTPGFATTYVFGHGSGQDLIIDTAEDLSLNQNTLVFTGDVALADLQLSREGPNGDDLVISIIGTADRITIPHQFADPQGVIKIVEVGGVPMFADDLQALLLPLDAPGLTVLSGTNYDDNFTLDAASHATRVQGWQGSDTYYFTTDPGDTDASDARSFTIADGGAPTWGKDTIFFSDDFADLSPVITPTELTLTVTRNGDTLVIEDPQSIENYVVGFVGHTYDEFLDEFTRQGLIVAGGSIVGTIDPEALDGTGDSDLIYAFGGSDTVTGDAGNDQIYGGDGPDSIDGGAGDDTIIASDDVFGFGGQGETVLGGDGDDSLNGSPFDDSLDGGDGADTMVGGYADDEYRGGSGDDTTYDLTGSETYHYDAGDGDDVIVEHMLFGQTNSLIFGGGITLADISYSLVATPDVSAVGLASTETVPFAIRFDIAGGGSVTLVDAIPSSDTLTDLELTDGSDTSLLSDIRAALNAPTAADQTIVQDADAGLYSSGAGDDLFLSLFPDFGFQYGTGDGNDTIQNDWYLNPVLFDSSVKITGGLTASDLSFVLGGADRTDLIVTLPSGEQLTIEDEFHFGPSFFGGDFAMVPAVQRFEFDDASVLTSDDLLAQFALGSDGVVATFDGDDVIEDTLLNAAYAGGPGSDTYQFGPGSGDSTISEGAPPLNLPPYNVELSSATDLTPFVWNDTLQLDATPDSVTVEIVGDDLLITLNDTGETVTIQDQMAAGNYGFIDPAAIDDLPPEYGAALGPNGEITEAYWELPVLKGDTGQSPADLFGGSPLFTPGIETFVFSDGTTLNRNEMANLAANRSTDGGDTMATDDAGGSLDGGLGNDSLSGGSGDDTYGLGIGTGDDSVFDAGGDDLVQFDDTVTPNLVMFSRTGLGGNDLLIEIDGLQRSAMTIEDQFAGHEIEEFAFFGGTVLTAEQVRQQILLAAATNGDDSIDGFPDDDAIQGLGGNDTIAGHGGDDVIDGGDGWDEAVFEGAAGDYVVTPTADGLRVVDMVGDEGTDLLTGIEDLQFLDIRDAGTPAPFLQSFAVNSAPVIPDAAFFTLPEDTQLRLTMGDLTGLGTDPDGDTLDLISVSDPVNGSVTQTDSGIVFTPTTDFHGTASFSFVLADHAGATASGNVEIGYTPVEDAPRAEPIGLSTDEDVPVQLAFSGILADAFDPDGDSLTIGAIDGATNGTLAVDDLGGIVTFTPAANFNGLAGFSVTVTDPAGESAVIPVTVDVAPVEDIPVAVGESGFHIPAGTSALFPETFLLLNEINPDGIALSILSVGDAVGGGVSFTDGVATFLANSGAAGPASFTYTVSGGAGTAAVSMTIDGAADAAPTVAVPIPDQTASEDSLFTLAVPPETFADADVGDSLTLTAGALPAWLQFGPDTQTFSGTPTNDDVGTVTVILTATDEAGADVSDDFDITVANTNDSPTGLSLAGSTVAENASNGTFVGTVTATDPDAGDTLSYGLLDDAGGRFAIDPSTGDLTVADASLLNFEAAESHDVLFRVTDAAGASYDAGFTIDVQDVNETPDTLALVSGGDVAENSANGTVVGQLAATDPDVGAALSYSLVDDAGGRFAVGAASGAITVADGSLLDYETATGHQIISRVTDQGGLSRDLALTIGVTDVAEGGGGGVYDGTNRSDDFTAPDDGDWIIRGNGGSDHLAGRGGDDSLLGGFSGDGLDGGAGSDTIIGDSGADTITGGAGEDIFRYDDVFDSLIVALRLFGRNLFLFNNADAISDFHPGEDRIDLSEIDARRDIVGNQAFTFRGEDDFSGRLLHGTSGQLRYDNIHGNTFVSADVNGDRIADFGLTLNGSFELDASDFLL